MCSFHARRSQKRKKDCQLKQLFALLGSARVKAVRDYVGEIDHSLLSHLIFFTLMEYLIVVWFRLKFLFFRWLICLKKIRLLLCLKWLSWARITCVQSFSDIRRCLYEYHDPMLIFFSNRPFFQWRFLPNVLPIWTSLTRYGGLILVSSQCFI